MSAHTISNEKAKRNVVLQKLKALLSLVELKRDRGFYRHIGFTLMNDLDQIRQDIISVQAHGMYYVHIKCIMEQANLVYKEYKNL